LSLLELGRDALAGVFAFFFVGFVGCNLSVLLRYYIRGTTGSQIPLFGGLAGCLALVVAPLDLSRWWWVPLLIDPGSALLILGTIGTVLWKRLRPQR